MFQNKKAYFQGTEIPKPKKKQYKSEPTQPVTTRFSEPFFKNYDLYNVPGKHGPGAGWHEMTKHKSVSDFLKKKRKKLKNKYKSKKIASRIFLFSKLLKNAIDYSVDEQIKSSPILHDGEIYNSILPFSGQLSEYNPINDFEGKSPDKLNFGRDYSDSLFNLIYEVDNKEKPIVSGPIPLYGLPDGIKDIEELQNLFYDDPRYGITDSGNTVYNNMWFV